MSKDDLRAAHGAPAEFNRALWAALAQGFITTQELEQASAAYQAEFEAAE